MVLWLSQLLAMISREVPTIALRICMCIFEQTLSFLHDWILANSTLSKMFLKKFIQRCRLWFCFDVPRCSGVSLGDIQVLNLLCPAEFLSSSQSPCSCNSPCYPCILETCNPCVCLWGLVYPSPTFVLRSTPGSSKGWQIFYFAVRSSGR